MAVQIEITRADGTKETQTYEDGATIDLNPGDTAKILDGEVTNRDIQGEDVTIVMSDGTRVTFVGLVGDFEDDNPAKIETPDGKTYASVDDLTDAFPAAIDTQQGPDRAGGSRTAPGNFEGDVSQGPDVERTPIFQDFPFDEVGGPEFEGGLLESSSAPGGTGGPGVTTFVTISVSDASGPEPSSSGPVVLSSLRSFSFGPASFSIQNDVQEDQQTSTLTFTVTLSEPVSEEVTVDFETQDCGTDINHATANLDYLPSSGTVIFQPGQTSATVEITILSDDIDEVDEDFKINLSNPFPTNGGGEGEGEGNGEVVATIADGQGIGTITDNPEDSVTISINDVSVTEPAADGATTTATFTVTLSNPSADTITVDFATADNGTALSDATAGADYVASSGTLTFTAGQTAQTIEVTVNGDNIDEVDEIFNVDLSNAAANSGLAGVTPTISDNQGVGTINDDRGDGVQVSIGDAMVDEPSTSSDTTTMTFTVTLSNPSSDTITVDFATADKGTALDHALAGTDYTASSGTLTFNAGVTSQTIEVTVNGDNIDEVDELFDVNLSNLSPSSGGTAPSFADDQGEGTIKDDPADAVTVSIGDAMVDEPSTSSDTTTMTFTVTLSNPSSDTITVDFATADKGTALDHALAGTDYTASSGTLTFNAGVTSQTIEVTVNGDNIDEVDELFDVNLSNLSPSSGGTAPSFADDQGEGTIKDDPADAVTVSIGDAMVDEPSTSSDTTTMTFTVTLSNPSSDTITVDFATADKGTALDHALAGTDYTASSGTLTFNAGVTSQTIEVTVNGDNIDEVDELFDVNLSNLSPSSGGTAPSFADDQGEGTIKDDPADAVTVSIGDAMVDEPSTSSDTTTMTFTVTLSNPSSDTITVDFATADKGTALDHALAGTDYTASSGTLTFNAGVTSQTIEVTVNGDNIDEVDELFDVNLSNLSPSSGGTAPSFADDQGEGTIKDDPADAVTVSIGDAMVDEPSTSSDTTTMTFTVTLSNPSSDTITVDFATADKGTALDHALAGTDYTASSGTLTFNAGVTSQTIEVTVNGDNIDEVDELFDVNLSNLSPSSGGTAPSFADDQGEGTIKDDPADAVTVSIGDAMVDEPSTSSDTTTMTFTVTLSNPSSDTITVDFATADKGTALDHALAGTDYTASSGTLTFNAGVTSQTIEVTVNGDNIDEVDELFDVNLSNLSPSSGGTAPSFADDQGEGTIKDDPADAVTVSIGDAMVDEPSTSSDTTTMTFTVTLSNPSSDTITVDFATADKGTALDHALAGTDYTASSGTLTFNAGVTSQTIEVTVNGDNIDEVDELFDVNLSNLSPSSGGTAPSFADDQGEGTIKDDPADAVTVSIGDAMVDEPSTSSDTTTMTFTVTLSNPSSDTITVDFATADKGTALDHALAGTDYTASSGTLTFNAGVTSQTIEVTVNGDNIDEVDELFDVNLSNLSPSSGGTAPSFADDQGEGTIKDDPADAVTVSIGDAMVDEPSTSSDTTTMTFTVTLSNPSSDTITVDFATADKGTALDHALAGTDYTASSGTLTFNAGVTSQTIEVTVNGDNIDEVDELFDVNLSNLSPSSGGTAPSFADDQGEGTIKDDPADAVTVSINDVTVQEPDGSSGTVIATFTVTLSNPSADTVTVDFATADDTATAGASLDYVATSGTLTFNPGVTSQTIEVTVNADDVDEDDEFYFVNLSNPTSNDPDTLPTIADNQGLGTIEDDNDAPVAEPDKHVWVSTDPAQQSPEYTNGYPLLISEPTDPDGDPLTITIDAVPASGQVGYMDGTFQVLSAGDTITTTQLQNLLYVPSADATDEPVGTFTYTAADATKSDSQTVTIHEVPPGADPIEEIDIGDGSSPLTSGNDQVADFTVTSNFATEVNGNLSDGAIILKTDFQQAPFTVPIPAGEREGTAAGIALENEVSVTLTITDQDNGTHTFLIVDDDDGDPNTWAFDSDSGLMRTDVDFSDIDGTGADTGTTLFDYLSANPTAAGDVWTITYLDDTGGNKQARLVQVSVFVDDPGFPGIIVDGVDGQSNLIYGTEFTDILNGGDQDDIIIGRGGADQIDGQEGSDTIWGGTGAGDELSGGTGPDFFNFADGDGLASGGAAADADQILDFTDTGGADDDVFGYTGNIGDLTFDSSADVSGGGANDTVVTVTATGEILAVVQDVSIDSADAQTVAPLV